MDEALLAWRVQEGATSQEVQVASRSWERRGHGLFSSPPEGTPPCERLDLGSVGPVLDF